MHKNLYASGFLYHIPSQQILLQQNPSKNTWSLFGDIISPNESSRQAFQRIIFTCLNKKFSEEAIYEIYEYYDTDLGKNNSVVYSELSNLEDFSPQEDVIFTWVKTKNIYKLPLSEQMKQNITVGQRVINARERDNSESQTNTILVNKA